MPGGQINEPSSGKHYSLPFLPATPSSPSLTLEGLFVLTRRPSQALDSPRVLLQRCKDTVRCAMLGAEVPGLCPKTADANLDRAFVVNALSVVIPKWEG